MYQSMVSLSNVFVTKTIVNKLEKIVTIHPYIFIFYACNTDKHLHSSDIFLGLSWRKMMTGVCMSKVEAFWGNIVIYSFLARYSFSRFSSENEFVGNERKPTFGSIFFLGRIFTTLRLAFNAKKLKLNYCLRLFLSLVGSR